MLYCTYYYYIYILDKYAIVQRQRRVLRRRNTRNNLLTIGYIYIEREESQFHRLLED